MMPFIPKQVIPIFVRKMCLSFLLLPSFIRISFCFVPDEDGPSWG